MMSTDRNVRFILGVTIGLSLFFFVLRLLQAWYKDNRNSARESPSDLSGCMHVIWSQINLLCGGDLDPKQLRLTLFRVNGEELEQCIDYVGGDDANGKAGRTFSLRSGIIGKVALTGNPVLAQRTDKDYERFLTEMAAEWHIPIAEGRNLRTDRWSWFGVPIKSETGSTIGIIFCDSNVENFFTEPVQQAIIAGAHGVSAYVHHRYRDLKG
jgi:hypothetical protein